MAPPVYGWMRSLAVSKTQELLDEFPFEAFIIEETATCIGFERSASCGFQFIWMHIFKEKKRQPGAYVQLFHALSCRL
jgi:hypothetical protein